MAIYESSEDYLERILMLKEEKGKIISLDLAVSFGYSKPSISRAVKNLKENNYITVNSKGEIDLTDLGYSIASKMLERHHMLTKLFESIGVDKDTASKDACKIEHDLSDETYDKLIEYFNKK